MRGEKVLCQISTILRRRTFNESWRYRLWRWLGKTRQGQTFWIPVEVGKTTLWLSGIHGKTDALINLKTIKNSPFQACLSLLNKNRSSLVVDIGANVGQSLLLIKSAGDYPVFCYEPSPTCSQILQNTVRKNRFRAVSIKNLALGKKAGVLNLFSSSDSDSNATVVPGFRKHAKSSLTVKVTTLDREMQKTPNRAPALIKIDVEGGELEVLEGAQKVLSKHRPIICLETLYPKSVAHQKRQDSVTKILKKARYKLFHFQEGEALRESAALKGDRAYQNNDYLCFPAEKTVFCLSLLKNKIPS